MEEAVGKEGDVDGKGTRWDLRCLEAAVEVEGEDEGKSLGRKRVWGLRGLIVGLMIRLIWGGRSERLGVFLCICVCGGGSDSVTVVLMFSLLFCWRVSVMKRSFSFSLSFSRIPSLS